MKRILAVAAVVCGLLCSACGNLEFWSIRTVEQANERARMLRAEAGGHRKDAREYEILIDQKTLDIKTYQNTVASLDAKRLEMVERVESLRLEKQEATGEGALALEKVSLSYQDKVSALAAQIDNKKTHILTLEDQIFHWTMLRDACLTRATDKEKEAARLDQYALELSQAKP